MDRLISFVLLPLLLLFLGWAIQEGMLWSDAANHTVPWFCTAVALAQVTVGIVTGLRGQPGRLPLRARVLTIVILNAILAVGCLVDAQYYSNPDDLVPALLEVLGFTVILTGLFALHGSGRSEAGGSAV